MKRILKNIIIVTATVGMAMPLFAHRPFFTSDAGVGGKGENIIESAWEMSEEADGSYSHKAINAFLFGLGGRSEIAIEAPYNLNGDEKGVQEINFGGKMMIAGSDEKSGMFTVKFGYSSPGKSVVVMFVGTKAVGDFIFHSQIGFQNEFGANGMNLGIAGMYNLGSGFFILSEVFGEFNSEVNDMNYRAGLLYEVADFVTLDFLAGDGFTSKSSGKNITAGATFTF